MPMLMVDLASACINVEHQSEIQNGELKKDLYSVSKPRQSQLVAMWFMTFLCSHLKMPQMPR